VPLFLHCCHQRPPITLCRLPLWSSELILPTLEISESEILTQASTCSVCLWQSRTFCSPPPLFGCSVCLAPPINRFFWKRRISSKNIVAKKNHTRPYASVTFSATICFKIHTPSHQDPTRSKSRPIPWPAPDPWSSKATCWHQPYLLLMSALAGKKK
jgi:hypothetical protein